MLPRSVLPNAPTERFYLALLRLPVASRGSPVSGVFLFHQERPRSRGCHAITAEGHRLLQRGQETGAVRHDVTYEDFIYVVTAICIAIENDRSSKSRIGHLVDLLLNGISVKGSE